MAGTVAMDALDCRSPARCRACEHWQGDACALEIQVDALLTPAPRFAVATLARIDIRKAAA